MAVLKHYDNKCFMTLYNYAPVYLYCKLFSIIEFEKWVCLNIENKEITKIKNLDVTNVE